MKTAALETSAGSSMLIILSVLATLSVCVVASLNYTAVVSRDVQRSNTMRTALEIGDGALDYAYAHWREICRPQPNTHRATADFATVPLPTQAIFPDVANFTSNRGANPSVGTPYVLANYKIKAVDPQIQDLASDTTAPIPATGMTKGTTRYSYLASADVTLPALSGKPVSVKVRRIFQKELLSPWNYAIFYTDRLEIHPSPPFTVTGWVHTNERLYTAHDTLTFASKVTYGDDWSVGFAPGDSTHSSETPQAPHYPGNLPPTREQGIQPFGLDSTRIFNTTDSNPNNDSYRELVERPTSGDTDPLADARYYNQADIRILVDASNAVVIKNSSDVTVTAASTGANKDIYDVVTAALTKNEKIQDNREQAEMRLVSLDMNVLYAALTPSNAALGTNGKLAGRGLDVIYVSDTSGSASVKRGVRLRNGSRMPPGGLTVASDNPVYIQGDYNTGRTASAETPANLSGGDPTLNTVSGYTREPCAVIADAVMLLSNSWVDANSYGDVSGRVATSTTFNTAIVSGIVPSGGGKYSGGAENFPRFMESWGNNKTLTYYGSMVELFTSKQNTGNWGNGNVYAPPTRKWYFDTNFYTNPPPGTLTLVSYTKQRWYRE